MKFTIRYDEPLMRRVIGDYIKASYRRRMMGVSVVVILGFALSFFVGSVWLRALWLAVLVFLPLMGVLAYAMRVRQSLRILGMLDDGRVEFTLDDEGVTTESALGRSLLKWNAFSELMDTPKAQLLLYTNSQFLTLPKDQTPAEAIAEIERRLAAMR